MIKKVIYTDNTDLTLKRYLRDISKYKLLDSSETINLIEKAQQGDLKAREQVINSNLRFVVTVAKQFQGRGIALMDLIEAGNLGLIKTIDKFDSTVGVTFLSYAIWWIKQSIYNSIYWQANDIRLPMSQHLLVNNIINATNKFQQEHLRNPSSLELAEMTGIDRSHIDFMAQFAVTPVSLDATLGDDEDNPTQMSDIIPSNDDNVDDVINIGYAKNEIHKCIDKLPIRERDLICMLYGIGMPKVNNKVVADMYGVSIERVRQLKELALERLRKKYGNKLKNLF